MLAINIKKLKSIAEKLGVINTKSKSKKIDLVNRISVNVNNQNLIHFSPKSDRQD
jgi:hypothetical protein